MVHKKTQAKHYILGGVCVLIAVIVLVSIISVSLLREREIETWRLHLSNLSLVLAEQTNDTMSSAQTVLNSIVEHVTDMGIHNAAELRAKARTEALFYAMRDNIAGLPQVDVATIVADNGDVINFTRSFPAPAINLSDRDYFKARRNDPSLGMFVGNAVRNKGNGKWVFYLSHRLNDSQGKFMGLVLVGISVDQFTDFYQRLGMNLGEGAAISLYRRDFSVLTRWPPQDELIGKKNLTGTSYHVIEELKKTEDVIYSAGPRFSNSGLSVARLGAVRVLDRFPMIVNLTVTEEYFLANWRHATKSIAMVATGSIIALMMAAILLLRIARQREQSSMLLRDLTDQVPGLLFQFQQFPDGRLVFPYVNQGFLNAYGLSPEQLPLDASTITAYLHPEDKNRFMESIRVSAQTLQPWREDYRMVLPESGGVWRHGDAIPQKLRDGSILWHGYISDITERMHAAQALQSESEKNLALLRNASDGIHILDHEGNLIEASDSFCRMLGYTRDEMIGMNVSRWDDSLNGAELQRRIQEQFDSKVRTQFESRHRRKDGTVFDVEISGYPLELDGKPALFNSSRDITERKNIDAELRIAATAFESQEGVLITDANNLILRVNNSFTKITGYTSGEVIGKNPRMFSSGRHDAAFYAAMWESINNTGIWEGEIWNRRKNGETFPERLIITAVKDREGVVTNYVASLADITLSKAAEEEIRTLAFYDPLTGLPNRRLIVDRLKKALASSSRSEKRGALLFIDLDNFKTLNDTLGHDIGDLLLQQVANRLESCVREGDTVARLGGDEFVVMLEDLSEHAIEAAAQTESVGQKIIATLNRPYQLGTHEHHSTPSIGISLFTGQLLSGDDLMKQADIAMYQSKKAGRNTLRFFDPQMQENINERAGLENELRKAVASRQFHLHYQVQVDDAHRATGVEALIRWIHPQRGLISPAQFIPMAEENGLILPIGIWVLETACNQLKAWQQKVQTRHLTMSVNVSAKQFRRPDFVTQVQLAVMRHAIDPSLLKLELTESMLLDNIEGTIATMSALNELGVQFSLDDFGTGYSSLQYLKRLPLDQLKIDQSFVRDLASDSSDKAIVRTIIAMAKSLNLNVIAEGVETEEQRQILLHKGCTQFQGYLFGRPLPIEEITIILNRI